MAGGLHAGAGWAGQTTTPLAGCCGTARFRIGPGSGEGEHHRFTQSHPFQDGNGRVARALASLVGIGGNAFPLVVMRQQQASYFRALGQADDGDLASLIMMTERQQREALSQVVRLLLPAAGHAPAANSTPS